MLQELHRIQVFMAAVNVGNPLSVILSVIQIEHGCHRVHTDAVGMILLCPEQSVGDEEVGYLRSGVIVNQGSPVRMSTLSRVSVLVEAGSVKLRHAPGVSREMGGNPVQDHADALTVHIVHEIHKVVRRAVTAGGSVVSAHLVSPGSVQRMLHHRKQLHMGIAHLFHIFRQLRRDLTVIVELGSHNGIPLFVRLDLLSHKGSQMELVNGHGLRLGVRLCTPVHPCPVIPFIFLNIPYDGCCVGTKLCVIGIGVRL